MATPFRCGWYVSPTYECFLSVVPLLPVFEDDRLVVVVTAEELSLVVVEVSFRFRQNMTMPKRPATIMVPHTMAAISKGKGIDMLFSPNASVKVPIRKIILIKVIYKLTK